MFTISSFSQAEKYLSLMKASSYLWSHLSHFTPFSDLICLFWNGRANKTSSVQDTSFLPIYIMPGFIVFPLLKTLSGEIFSLFQQFTLFPRYLLFSTTRHLQLSDALHWMLSAPLLLTHLASWHLLANLPSLFLDLAALRNSAPPAKSATSQFTPLY